MYKKFNLKTSRDIPTRKLSRRLEDIIKTVLKLIRCEDADWINLVLDRS